MRRIIAASFGVIALGFAGAMPAQAAEDGAGPAIQVQATGPAECQDEGTEEVTIAVTNPGTEGMSFVLASGADFSEESELGAKESRDYAVPFEPGAEFTVENADADLEPVTVTLPQLCPAEESTDDGNNADDTAETEQNVSSDDCAAYADSGAWCEEGVGDYNCDDIDDSHKPIEVVDPDVDPFQLDADADGKGCELPSGGDDGSGEGGGDGGSESGGQAGPSDCDAYADSGAWCDESAEDYNCDDIDDSHKPIEVVDPDVDPFQLDADADGKGCELPSGGDDGSDEGGGNASGDDTASDGGALDELPDTGANVILLAMAALALLSGGVALVARRMSLHSR